MKSISVWSCVAVPLGLFLTGCATFPQYKVKRIPAPVQVERCAPQDTLHVDIRYQSDELISDRKTMGILKRAVEKVATEIPACFSSVSVSTANSSTTTVQSHLTRSDIKLDMNLQLHNNIIKEAAIGFVGGVTSFVVPVWCTYPFTLTSIAASEKGGPLPPLVLDDSVRLWMHALFILYPKSPGSALQAMLENMVREVFQKTDWTALAASK